MSAESLPKHPEELLESHIEWIRALARAMARDASVADELAQETCVVALQAQPREPLAFRAWLTAVMRRLLWQRGRSEERRHVREERAARREATEALVEQVVAGRELAQAVLELAEPYRTAILLRFYEELQPREIAARLGVPVATVHSRIGRGLKLLRERLDATREGPNWLAALVPISLDPRALSAFSVGGLIVNAKLALSLVAVVLVATVVALTRTGGETASIEQEKRAALERKAPIVAASTPSTGEAETESAPELEARAPLAAATPSAAPSAPEAGAKRQHKVRGRALDGEGLPIQGVPIGWSGTDTVLASTRALGAFEFTTEAESGNLEILDRRWTSVRSGSFRAEARLEPLVIAAVAAPLAGIVVDASGNTLSGARIALELPEGFAGRFDQSLEATRGLEWRATSDAQGHFELPRVPLVSGATLRAVLEGYSMAEVPEPAGPDAALTIVMHRPQVPLTGALRGRVVDPHGTPVMAARVFVGLATTLSDERGNFAIELKRSVSSDRIVAIKQGFRPAVMERPRAAGAGDTGWPEEIELMLPGEALSIRGSIVDEKGEPRAGVRVWVADPTPAGVVGKMPTHLESLSAGGAMPPQVLESEGNVPEQDGESVWESSMNIQPASAFWHWVLTDKDGNFEIGGLDERRYKLRAMDPKSLQSITTDGIEAGERGARLTLPAPKLFEKFAGRVVDDQGRGVAGVRVHIAREAFGARMRVFGGHAIFRMQEERKPTLTDSEGRFEFKEVPRETLVLHFKSDRIVPSQREVEPEEDAGSLEVKVFVRCALEVRILSSDLLVDDMLVRGEGGKEIPLLRIDEESTTSSSSMRIQDGKSGILSASSEVRTLVLRFQGNVVRELAVRLEPDRVNTFEF
jgi:RNA polymerase sigma-70 factor, ECF subfamily